MTTSPIPPIHDTPAEEMLRAVPRHAPPHYAEAARKSTTRSDGEKREALPPGHPGFLAILEEMEVLHRRKGADYGTNTDHLANVRASADFGIAPWIGVMIRANDKLIRLKNAAKGSALLNEGVEDSLMDLAAYAIIALVLYREQYGQEP